MSRPPDESPDASSSEDQSPRTRRDGSSRRVGDRLRGCDRLVWLGVATDPCVELKEPLGDGVGMDVGHGAVGSHQVRRGARAGGVKESGDDRVVRAAGPFMPNRCYEYVSRVIHEPERVLHERSGLESRRVAVGYQAPREV